MPENKTSDFFEAEYGRYWGSSWRRRLRQRLEDCVCDVRLLFNPSYLSLRQKISLSPRRAILIIGVEVPARAGALRRVMDTLSQTRHHITLQYAPLLKNKGKFQNINLALAGLDKQAYDWIIIVDDDIAVPAGFMDVFIYLAEYADIRICQPAHKRLSYQTFELTQRCQGSLVRITGYVESGPCTAFHRSTLPYVLPFPDLRWAWGTDLAWGETAYAQGWRMGIVDAAPIRHLRPVAQSYDPDVAMAEAKAYIRQAGIRRSRKEILQTKEIVSQLR